MNKSKHCATCTRKLIGRSDKVFCDKKCQNKHHAIAKLCTVDIQKDKYNTRIKRNYVILKGILSSNSCSAIINKNKLFKLGFDLSYFLVKKKQHGKYIKKIKEFEFVDIGNGKIQVTRTKKGSPYFKEFINRWERECPLIFNVAIENFRGGLLFYFERLTKYTKSCLVVTTPLTLSLRSYLCP